MIFRIQRKFINIIKLCVLFIALSFLYFLTFEQNKQNVLVKEERIRQMILHKKLQDWILIHESFNYTNEFKELSLLKNNFTTLQLLSFIINKINNQQPIINQQNLNQKILNTNNQNFSLVIVVQVHNRLHYLSHLIESLSNIIGIEEALLIFSNDYYDPEINEIIQKINFCQVMQIFYPYSLQLNPNNFPGTSENDCPRNISKYQAQKIGCNNANNPDRYGHYREAVYSQTKHHWFWKMNFVFDKLNRTRTFNGPFLLLEEDHYVSEDAIYILRLMQQARKVSLFDLIILGAYTKTISMGHYSNRVLLRNWISSKHNMGMVINRTLWNSIKSCANSFCNYDDYNWDWSLQHVSMTCLKKPLTALTLIVPRVFHIGECGVHHKGECEKEKLLARVKILLASNKKYFYPKFLIFTNLINKKNFKMPQANGGWADPRDHNLCLKFIS